jgi:ABC-type nitrate/sulfonate/bicarbonate transport system permease component
MPALVLTLLALGAWQLWALSFAADTRAPYPARVAAAFCQLSASGELPMALLQSLVRVLAGFVCAFALGTGLGLLMGSSRALRENLDPVIEAFRPIAPMALLPIAILWLWTGTPASVSIVAYAAFFPLLVNTVHGVSRVDARLVHAARTMGLGRAQVLRRVLLGARLAMGVAWTAIIAAELAVGAKSGGGTSSGIGQMMFVFYAYSVDLNGIVVCMLVVGAVALAIDRGFRAVEHVLLPWRRVP